MVDRRSRRVSRRALLQATTAAAALRGLSRPTSAAPADGVYVDENESTVAIGNDSIEVTFRTDDGGIEQIYSHERDVALRDPDAAVDALTWQLVLDYVSESWTSSARAGRPSITTEIDGETASVSLTWSNPDMPGVLLDRFDGDVTVDVTLRAADRLARWSMSVTNRTDLAVSKATCPVVTAIQPPVDDGSDAIVFPTAMGRRVEDPTALEIPAEAFPQELYPMEFMNMQFTAYTGGGTVFYIQAEDATGHQKSLEWLPETADDDRLRVQFSHHAPLREGSDLTVPYEVAVGWFEGDWYDAADRYRSWVDEHGWLPDEPPGLPDWTLNLGAAQEVWSYPLSDFEAYDWDLLPQTYEETVDLARSYMDVMGLQTHQAVWLYWWDPEADPPVAAEGDDALRAALGTFEENEIAVAHHESPMFASDSNAFWRDHREDLLEWAFRTRDGEPRTSVVDPEESILSDPVTLYTMDFAAAGWQRQLRRRYSELAALGMREINLDGFPAYWQPCFSERHDHPPGRGAWFPRTSREELRQMKRKLREERSDAILSGEGIADFYLPYMDLHRTKDAVAEGFYRPDRFGQSTGDIIPLFTYTFGDHVVTRARGLSAGKRSDLSPPEENFERLAIGRTVEWGAIPEFLAQYGDAPSEAHGTYGGRIARARETYANRFMSRGEMLRKQVYDEPTGPISDTVTDRYGETREIELTGSAIKASAWRSPRGEVGLVFTNVSPDEGPHRIELDVESQPFELPPEPRLVYAVTNGEYELVASADDAPGTITLELAQMDVSVLVFARAAVDRTIALEAIVDAQAAGNRSGSDELGEPLWEAKRAFEADDTAGTLEKTRALLGPEETESSSSTSPTETGRTASATSTTVETPGFTTLSGIIGALGGIGVRWLVTADADEEDEG